MNANHKLSSTQRLFVGCVALAVLACGSSPSPTPPGVVGPTPPVGMPVVGGPTPPTGVGMQPTLAQVVPSVTIPPAPPGADPRAVDRMNEYTAQKLVQGYLPHGAPGADTLTRNASRDYSVTLTAGDCYTLAAFGGNGVRDLDIYLNAPSGRQVAQDVLRDSRPIVNTCVQETGAYRVRILMYAGSGPFTYQIYRNPGAAAVATGIAGIDATVLRRMDAFSGRLTARGFRAMPALSGAGTLGAGQRQSFTVPLAQTGSCYAFVGFAGTGMRDLDIYLNDPNGTQLRRDVAVDPVADVKWFVTQPGPYQITLNAYAGSGAFAYQVYQLAGACP